ncbi:MAG TPA: hypothetical protein VNI52_14450 [Sphingobacteriaceae bacterium]|nr:hypothetical protein [Sphingobacteriaceae bacterium]
MKFIAIFVSSCILFLTASAGIPATLYAHQKENCCQKQAVNKNCDRNQQDNANDNCAKGICNPFFSCSGCGLLKEPNVIVKSVFSFMKKEIPASNTGIPSDYSKTDWHPPKV